MFFRVRAIKTHNSTKNYSKETLLGQDGFLRSSSRHSFYYGFLWDSARRVVRYVTKVLQPLSQLTKDVARFHVAAPLPQVTITDQQGTLNNSRTFCKEKGT